MSAAPGEDGPEAAGSGGRRRQALREYPASRLEALIFLLGDDSPRVRATVRRHLLEIWQIAEERLLVAAHASEDPAVRAASAGLLTDVARCQALDRWRRFASAPDPLDLEKGTFLIARTEFPRIDMKRYTRLLDDYARVLERRLAAVRETTTIVDRINHLLFRELGFHGNREDYHAPENSYMNQVLERKLGIPITLSVLCMLVGKRLDVELEGVGLPGHFILRYHEGRRDHYLDPFNAGRRWTVEDCLQHVRAEGYDIDEECLRASTPRKILIRTLANLLHIYRGLEDSDRVSRVVEMLEALNPGG